jgi:hypothetical protein
LGTLSKLDRDTDVLIAEILSWTSIIDLHKILLVNTYFSNEAKQCEQWEKLLAIIPIPNLHACSECGEEYPKCEEDFHNVYGGCCGPFFDDPRIYSIFEDLSTYEKCTRLMPVAQICVKNLLSFYDLNRQPEGFAYTFSYYWNNSNRGDFDIIEAKIIDSIVTIETQYPKRWILLHNIVSLAMAADEREWLGLPPSCFLFAFTGYEMSPNSGCDESQFRQWYKCHLCRGVGSDNSPSVGSDEHLRFLVSQRHEERARMVATLGMKL